MNVKPWKFDPPANLTDFSDPEVWHQSMAREAREIVRILATAVLGHEPTSDELAEVARQVAYVDPMAEEPPTREDTPIEPWGAFPRAVVRRTPWSDLPADRGDPDGRYRAADHLGDEDFRPGVFVDRHDRVLHLPVRDRQDEYLEWTLRRNGGKITSAIFVAEGYDYFEALFDHDEQKAVELYREFTGVAAICADDLRAPNGVYRRSATGVSEVVKPGRFNPRNRFNIAPGIAHLSHRANSLGAEVNLAGVSGIARFDVDKNVLDNKSAERLLCCSEGGNPNRNSDPLIAQQAYSQVLGGFRYTLANPVGLYIANVRHSRLLLPDNETEVPAEWWRVTRGSADPEGKKNRILRLELKVPESEKLTISDLLVDGAPVEYGGQLADLLTVHLFVTRWRREDSGFGPVVGCTATCCRRTAGHPQLVLSDGNCGDGFEVAFPGLVPSATAEGIAAMKSLAASRIAVRGRRLP